MEIDNRGGGWLYSKEVKEHFFHPRNYLETENFEADGTGTSGSQVCGDLMKVWIKVDPKTKRIVDCKWQTFGCASAIASTSMMSVMVLENGGMTLDEAKELTAEKIMERLGGLPDNKVHCSVLGHLALRDAINDYLRKNGVSAGPREGYFHLVAKRNETEGISTLEFAPEDGNVFNYKAGQFAVFKMPEKKRLESLNRAYTITSLPGEKNLSITVKRAGVFSNALCDLAVGGEVAVTGPYGKFYPDEKSGKDLVFLAGGIGITPFLGAIRDLSKKESSKKVFLFYSNKTAAETIFRDELDKLAGKWKNLKIVYILTREAGSGFAAHEKKRVDFDMIKKYVPDPARKDYFICGSSEFVLGLKEQLQKAGIEPASIKNEFF